MMKRFTVSCGVKGGRLRLVKAKSVMSGRPILEAVKMSMEVSGDVCDGCMLRRLR
jgi:hypothetical protein